MIDVVGATPAIPTTFTTDSGSAVPVLNVIEVLGESGSVNTSGSGNTVTINLTGPVSVAKGGTGLTSATDGAVLVGNGTSAMELIGPLTDGQLLIGDTAGGSPVASTLTAGSGITITNTAGSIELSSSGSAALSFPTDSGTATPAANELTVTGGAGISTSGSGSTVTISLTGGSIALDAITPDSGTDPVVPDGTGLVTVIGDSTTTTTVGGLNQLTVQATTNFQKTGMHGWNGSLLETAAVSASSDGATITFSVERSGGGDLIVVFSDGYYSWDTTPADTVTLTAGSDTSPQINYVYLLQSTKTLTASTVGWPATEHAPLATVLCQSAASFQTDGAYKFHAWTDHVTKTSEQGHVADLNFWIRQQQATWVSGVGQTYTITTNGGAADNVILTTAAGVVLQLHDHTFPAFAGTPDVYVVNDNVTPYTKVTDLNALLTDSTGASMSGRYFSLVIWGVVSEDTGDCKLMCNLPGGSYNNQAAVENDADAYANYSIPNDFVGTGFLISEWKLRHQAAASGTWTSIDEIDLRGLLPSLTAGGGTATNNEFVDNVFRIVDDGDNTKEIAFEASGITTATTRTMTVPDASGTIAYASGLEANGFAYALDGNTVDSTAAATNGQLLIGSTGVAPVASSLTAPAAGITITGGAGSITFALADSLAALEGLTGNGVVVKTGSDTFTERTITGTSSRITVTNGDGVSGNPTVDISAAYVGQTSITTLGTVSTGTWEATDVGVAHGGTGLSSTTAYAVLCGGTTSTAALQSIASVGTSGQVLTSNGAGALPTFQDTGVSSPVTVPDGGTGLTTITDGGIMLGSGTGAVTPTAQPGDGQLLVGADSADPNLLTSWMQQGNNCWFWNLSFTHAAGTLTLAGADGTALSATNPGYVVMPSNATIGRMALHKITANDTLTVSDMTGNLFGTTTAIAWTPKLPLYVGFMADATDANIEPVITRIPNLFVSPASSANIGDPSSATADLQESCFAWNDITETNYQSKNIGLIGSLTATKAVTTDAWTLDALTTSDGVGKWNDSTIFEMALGQNGATAGAYLAPNGGTAPVFTDLQYDYTLSRYGDLFGMPNLNGDGGTDGSGAVNLTMASPLAWHTPGNGRRVEMGVWECQGTSGSVFYQIGKVLSSGTSPVATIQFDRSSTNALLINSAFANGGRYLQASYLFKVFNGIN